MSLFRKGITTRALVMGILIIFLFTLDAGRLFYLQIVKGAEYSEKAQGMQLSDTEIKAARGSVYDSDGNVLAQSATVWEIYLDPSGIKQDATRQKIVDFLAEAFEYDEEQKAELMKKASADNKYQVVEKKAENRVKEIIAEFVAENKLTQCIGFAESTRRYYPYGTLASTVLGFTNTDSDGVEGIEFYYNDVLSGTNGRIITAKDAKARPISDEYETAVAAQDGNSLILTINTTIQYYLEKELRRTLEEYDAQGCYGVVMDCNTGAVLAMSSMPDYDPNDPYKINYDAYQKQIDEQKTDEEKVSKQGELRQKQWRNFVVSDNYETGSVFKTFMACAALEEGTETLDTKYTCTGKIQVKDRTIKCHYHKGHGTQTFTQGLENSCNPFFVTVGQRLGSENYFKYFEGFGFTGKTGIDTSGETSSQFVPLNKLDIVALSSASFGQTNSLTPIQICTGICAVANGGKVLTPYLVSEIRSADGNTVSKTEPNVVRQVISEETSKKVCKMMQSVVDNGTGKNGYVSGYNVGGKTGTSTKLDVLRKENRTEYIVSFAAIAPSDNPQIAMLIICDDPSVDLGGGAICAPIAATVIEEAMKELGIEPTYSDEEKEKLSVKTPNTMGKDVDSAKTLLAAEGLKAKIIGNGGKVLKQSPAAGDISPSGGTVVLYTENAEPQRVKVPSFAGLTITEANRLAADSNLNIEISGNSSSNAQVVAYKQSADEGTEVEIGSVVTVSFKSIQAVLD